MLEGQPRAESEMACTILSAAERLDLVMGRLDRARVLADQVMARLRAFPTPYQALAGAVYNAACVYARCGERAKALDAVRVLKVHGYAELRDLAQDSDMTNVARDPEFLELILAS